MATSQRDIVSSVVQRALKSVKEIDLGGADPDADVFRQYGFASLDTVLVLANIERDCGVFIGDHVDDWKRIRTLSGLIDLVCEKIAQNGSGELVQQPGRPQTPSGPV